MTPEGPKEMKNLLKKTDQEDNGNKNRWDPREIAGTPEWKAKVQAEAGAKLVREIKGQE